LTTETKDKKPEDCKNAESCSRLRSLADRDMLPFQRREAALAICARCDEFEDNKGG